MDRKVDPEFRARFYADMAEENPKYTLRCIFGEKVFFMEDTEPRIPGHICSKDGEVEYTSISRMCEYHYRSYIMKESSPSLGE